MPNIKNIQKWIDALRSGEYEQGRCYLQTSNNHFCCLGVACDVYIKETQSAQWAIARAGQYYFNATGDSVWWLPAPVQEWLGIYSADPIIHIGKQAKTLTTANDYLKQSFNEIADLIEAEWFSTR